MKEWLLKKRWRIILSGTLIVTIPLIVLSTYIYLKVTSVLEERLLKENERLAQFTAHTIEEKLRAEIAFGKSYAARPYFLEGLIGGNKKEIRRHLMSLIENSNTIERVFITDHSGAQVDNYPFTPETIGKTFSARDWYKGLSKNWTPYVSEFYMRTAKPQRYLFAIAIPMRYNGKIVGCLVMQPRDDFIKNAVGSVDLAEALQEHMHIGHIYVVDRKGNLVYHPDYKMDRIIDFSNVPPVRNVLKGMEGIEKMIGPVHKLPVLAAYHPVSGWGWGVVVEQQSAAVLAPARKIRLALFIITGFMLLLGGFIAYKASALLASVKMAEENLAVTLHSIGDGVLVVDVDQEIVRLNPVAEQLTGWTEAEARGRKVEEVFRIISEETRLPAAIPIEEVLSTGLITGLANHTVLIARDGTERPIADSAAPIYDRSNEMFGVVMVFRDVTPERDAEKSILKASEQAEAANKAKSDFLANMSHELRTPLNAVIGFSEVLQDEMFGTLNEKQKEYITDILVSGRHLLNLINDILDLSKVEAGKLELELSTFPLKDALNAALCMFKEKAMKHSLKLDLEIEPEAEIEIEADERKLKQIMFNLLSNAVKFTPDGGSVSVQTRLISDVGAIRRVAQEEGRGSASPRQDSDFIEISVTDTGIGIKPEDIPKLFIEFSQLGSAYTKEYAGTGLGLVLTKRLVELHGGMIWVKSESGKGSTFAFSLPVRQASKPLPFAEEHLQMEKKPMTGKRTLIIDDDPKTIELMQKALMTEGYTVLSAPEGKTGVMLAKQEKPDFIVLDLLMPRMNGFETVEALRNTPDTASVPIIILTGMDLSLADKNKLKDQVQRIIEKGHLDKKQFVEMVKETIEGITS
ncbi:MAG: response regulator [Nitrospirae bacterium]|nr:MAG: response regulator [Nitrospirota bacterium]